VGMTLKRSAKFISYKRCLYSVFCEVWKEGEKLPHLSFSFLTFCKAARLRELEKLFSLLSLIFFCVIEI
jgi:hypothetical protein